MLRTGGDCRQPSCACTAQQSKQKCLSLIVGGMTRECMRAKDFAASLARPSLEVRTVCEIDLHAAVRHVEALGDLTGTFGVVVGRLPQPMVDMDGVYFASRSDGQEDQSC